MGCPGRWVVESPSLEVVQPIPVPHHSQGKSFFLTSNLNLPWCNLRPFPLALSVSPGRGRPKEVPEVRKLILR